jgi:hypothetical protein
MAVAVVVAFATGGGALLIRLSLAVGMLCKAESLAMSLILPEWVRDVKGIAAAMRRRRERISRAGQRPVLTYW